MHCARTVTTSVKKNFHIHEEHPCTKCWEKLSYFTELLKHIAKYHCMEPGDVESKDKSKEKDDKVPSFAFTESMLNEFLGFKKWVQVK